MHWPGMEESFLSGLMALSTKHLSVMSKTLGLRDIVRPSGLFSFPFGQTCLMLAVWIIVIFSLEESSRFVDEKKSKMCVLEQKPFIYFIEFLHRAI